MRHQERRSKLNRTSAHRTALLRNMALSLFEHERITTTQPKARVLRPYAEKLITLAKRGDLHARRLAAAQLTGRKHTLPEGALNNKKAILKKLFDDIGPRFKTRPGGYLRILRVGFRTGDNAPMSLIELVDRGAGASTPAATKTVEPAAAETPA